MNKHTLVETLKKQLRNTIVTVTLNPALDQTLWVKGFRSGITFLAERSETIAAGKGVSVSRTLGNLGIVSTAIGILPENGSEYYLNLLQREGLKHDFLIARGDLRTNITIVGDGKKQETHLRQKGAPAEPDIMKRFRNKYAALMTKKAFFVFSGSLPPGLSCRTYQNLIKDVSETCAGSALDTSGPALKQSLSARPSLIKPNVEEVKDALGFTPSSKKDILRASRTFHGMGIENVMISLGKKGIVWSQKSTTIHARIRIPDPVNTVGSGDACLGGGLLGTLCNLSPEESARLSCGLGAANTLESGACVFRVKDVVDLYEKVKITCW